MNLLQSFLSLLLTMVLAYFLLLFVLLATGSAVLAWVIAGVTGLYFGFRDARRARKVRDGKTE